jgi:hypothetical protein
MPFQEGRSGFTAERSVEIISQLSTSMVPNDLERVQRLTDAELRVYARQAVLDDFYESQAVAELEAEGQL